MTAQLSLEELLDGTTEPNEPTGHGRLQATWHRIRRAVAEMNYANRRLVEVQAPWITDPEWHRR
jgi:hypothetical protein